MHAKDIPDDVFLRAVTVRSPSCALWYDLLPQFPGIPYKVLRAKADKLIRRGLLDGCPCGCSGQFEVTYKGNRLLHPLNPPAPQLRTPPETSMQKIPSLFERDFTTGARSAPVTGGIQPGTEWVLTDDGVIARRKWNGTAVLCEHRDGRPVFYVRRSVPFGPNAPAGFIMAEIDDATGRMFGWEPAGQSGYAAAVAEAALHTFSHESMWPHHPPATGTYELIGPKVHGNPEKRSAHSLQRHDTAPELEALIWRPMPGDEPLECLANIVQTVHGMWGWEGLVFYHPDGRRAKLKARDAREYLNGPKPQHATDGA